MRAVVITRPGGPDVLEVQEREIGVPVADQVRVRVRATGINRADLLQRQGRYPAPAGAAADIPGLELAGEVEAVGPDVRSLKIGTRVFGLLGGGGYAEYILSTERMVVPIPDNLTDTDAAAVPEVFITAYDALFTQADFMIGEQMLVHAAASGVGTAALQLAKAAGGRTFGTARSPEKLQRLREYGLDVPLSPDNFAEAIQQETAGAGVNVVLDFVGAPYLAQNLASLSMLGRLVQIGTMGGSKETIDLSVLMGKRLKLMGTLLRSRSLEEKMIVTRRFAEHVVPLLARGVVRPVVDRIFPLAEAAQAHAYVESNTTVGKVILQM